MLPNLLISSHREPFSFHLLTNTSSNGGPSTGFSPAVNMVPTVSNTTCLVWNKRHNYFIRLIQIQSKSKHCTCVLLSLIMKMLSSDCLICRNFRYEIEYMYMQDKIMVRNAMSPKPLYSTYPMCHMRHCRKAVPWN